MPLGRSAGKEGKKVITINLLYPKWYELTILRPMPVVHERNRQLFYALAWVSVKRFTALPVRFMLSSGGENLAEIHEALGEDE